MYFTLYGFINIVARPFYFMIDGLWTCGALWTAWTRCKNVTVRLYMPLYRTVASAYRVSRDRASWTYGIRNGRNVIKL